MKSTRSSALALRGFEFDEIFFQSSLTVEGVLAELNADADWSMDLLKHQILPLIGNTTNVAFIVYDKMSKRKEEEEFNGYE